MAVNDGVWLISEERRRQIREEGWSYAHDDAHNDAELALAAACYAMPSEEREMKTTTPPVPIYWPWDKEWWKPSPESRIRELVKAGALIAAEIDRLQRIETGKALDAMCKPPA